MFSIKDFLSANPNAQVMKTEQRGSKMVIFVTWPNASNSKADKRFTGIKLVCTA